jgi:AraC-like DNA-binding protein
MLERVQPGMSHALAVAVTDHAILSRDAVIRTQVVRAALTRVKAAGGDIARLLEQHGLPATAETDADVVLPLRTLHAFMESAERAARDPNLGLHMAEAFPRGVYGVVEFIARSCGSLREGLHRILQYSSLITNRVVTTFEERDGVGTIEHRIPGEPLATGRHANEFFVCALVLQARELTGVRFAASRAWFAHPAPTDVRELASQLGTRELRFGAGVNRLELPESVLALPFRAVGAALRPVEDRTAAPRVEHDPTVCSFMARVRASIEHQLASGSPNVDAVARELTTSSRTLQRRLGEEGTSFRDVVETVRSDLARSYLDDLGLGLGDVAFRLGYAEVSAFLRAFKRWTGMTPSQYRQRA